MFWNTKQSWREGTKLKVFALFVLLVYLLSFFMNVTENCQIFFIGYFLLFPWNRVNFWRFPLVIMHELFR